MELTHLFLCIISTAWVLGVVQSDSITVTSCGDPSKALVKVNKFEYSPNPVSFPSNITMSVEFDILQDIVAPVAVKTAIAVEAKGRKLQIPCMNGIGSCYHSDICGKLATDDCPDFFKKNNLQCQCPFLKGPVSLSDLKVYIPLGHVQGEDFHINVEIYTNNVFALCLDIHAIHNS